MCCGLSVCLDIYRALKYPIVYEKKLLIHLVRSKYVMASVLYKIRLVDLIEAWNENIDWLWSGQLKDVPTEMLGEGGGVKETDLALPCDSKTKFGYSKWERRQG